MKFLNGTELAGFIKERQAKQVRNLRQQYKIFPKILIIISKDAARPSQVYVNLKKAYGEDILIETQILTLNEAEMPDAIEKANRDPLIHGIIVQLPLSNPQTTNEVISKIDNEKDIDGLKPSAKFISATAEAINWLLTGYNVNLGSSKLAIVGRGKLVGEPLERLWMSCGFDVAVIDLDTAARDRQKILAKSNVVVTATGQAGSIKSAEIPHGAVVVDAGVADISGQLKGDLEESIYETRDDLTLTPKKGGVGPLTVAALYDHVIEAALQKVSKI